MTKKKINPPSETDKCHSNNVMTSLDLMVKLVNHIGKDVYDSIKESKEKKICIECISEEKGTKIVVGTIDELVLNTEDECLDIRFTKSTYSIDTTLYGKRRIIEYSEDGCLLDINLVDEYSILDIEVANQMIDENYMEIKKMLN